jgi:xylulokinase
MTGVNELTQAVIEGVSFALRDCLEALRKTGAAPSTLTAIGGGSASDFWLKTLATLLNMPLEIPKAGEFGAALGAARLAICGRTGKTPQQVMRSPNIERTIEPDISLQETYETGYRHFSKSYNHLRGLQ